MIRKKRRVLDPSKRLGKSAVSKGPARDKAHLARVRREACIVCVEECTRGMMDGSGPVQAHHVRCIVPRSMGVRVSDYLTVPLCGEHHDILHSLNEYRFWYNRHINPRDFIRGFSPEGAAEIERLTRKDPTDG